MVDLTAEAAEATATATALVSASASVTPAVTFGEGRRAESRTQVRIETFDGPLGLLLSLIEARQLDVTTVPLGALAGAYLDALAGLEADRLGNVSSFVAIASQLILIKSRAILPRRTEDLEPGAPPDEGADPEAELRARLLIYRAYRDAGGRLAADAVSRIGLFHREPSAAQAAALAGARPAEAPALDPQRLVRALDRLAAISVPPEPPPEAMRRTITLTERAELIRSSLRGASTVVLQDLLEGVSDRVVIAVTFLAMLELMKRREIVVEQRQPWGPIVARATTVEERAAAGVGDGRFDGPLDESLESFA
jgi:segregation and condensation protein A